MNNISTIIITILIYSAITTLIFIASKENDDVAVLLAIGVLAIVLIPGFALIRKLISLKKFGGKRSIILDNDENKYYWCKLSDTNDLSDWFNRYKLKTRYATKDEWSKYERISQEKIEKSKINCDYCADECSNWYENSHKCKTDSYEFFKPKTKH